MPVSQSLFLPAHGGALQAAAHHYDIPREQWLDLSTGINPHGYGADIPDASHWQRLPEFTNRLAHAVQDYYGPHQWLIANGSQSIIQWLPWLMTHHRLLPERPHIGMLAPSYSGHTQAWSMVSALPHTSNQITSFLEPPFQQSCDAFVLVHPNNPTGSDLPLSQRNQLVDHCQAHQRWLIIDEAFIDATPEQSLLNRTNLDYCLVLRSLGKFFGLPGWRVGFGFGDTRLIELLQQALGPWPVATPALSVTEQCLRDSTWQQHTRDRLHHSRQRMTQWLEPLQESLAIQAISSTTLFATLRFTTPEEAQAFYSQAAQQGILLRYFANTSLVRLGWPAQETDWARLETFCDNLRQGHHTP